jgi:hypothetical protein
MLRLSRRSFRSFSSSVLPAALVALTGTAAVAQDLLPEVFPAGSMRGEAAIERLGDQLPALAEEINLSADELLEHLRTDDSMWVARDNSVFFIEPAREDVEGPPPAYAGTIPTSEAFLLHSNPGATIVVYMDFDGHHSVSNSWGHNIQFPPYNTSGNSDNFSNGELNEIIAWWDYVAEDFAPFDVDVTTEEPPPGGLTKNGSGDTSYGMRCVITQPTSGFGSGIGGVAQLNTFNDSNDNPCFAFNKGNNTGSMTVSHEVGHTFGLSHDGLNGQSYHPGTGSGAIDWGPIMGAPFGSNVVHWSNGDYSGASTGQNDLNIITNNSNGIDYKADDYGDSHTDATPIPAAVGCPSPAPGSITGLIERNNDVDSFSFSTTGGVVTIQADPHIPGPNLDIQLDLVTSTGVPVAAENQDTQVSATMVVDLAPGSYVVLIEGSGSPNYSDYGSIGEYTVAVSLPGTTAVTNLGGGVPGSFAGTPNLAFTGTPCGGESVALQLTAGTASTQAFLLFGIASLGVPFKGGTLWPDFNPPGDMLALQTSFLGTIFINGSWPNDIPSGTELYFQYWMPDAVAVQGLAASNGLRIFTP